MSKARDLANAGTALTTVSATELGYLDGVTSAVQTQINSKEATLPSQTGNSGKYLTTDGSAKSWGTVSIPAQGNLKETVFTSSNSSWSIPTGVTGIWALVVGGGGGGGASHNNGNTGGGGGGAGRVLETFFTVSGDTTLNITIGAGGAGGTSGGKGTNGSTSSIVGNTSSTSYASAIGGGGGGGGTAANNSGLTGASGGGNGQSAGIDGGGGGGASSSPANSSRGFFGGGTSGVNGGGGSATDTGVTGHPGSSQGQVIWCGNGIRIWNRNLASGGIGGVNGANDPNMHTNFGTGITTNTPSAGSSATANTGAGGNSGKSSTTTYYSGGAGGSGLVVLRYVG
jgi:hypothetical protein